MSLVDFFKIFKFLFIYFNDGTFLLFWRRKMEKTVTTGDDDDDDHHHRRVTGRSFLNQKWNERIDTITMQ